MTESAGTDTSVAWRNVVDDVVGTVRVARYATNSEQMIQTKQFAQTPCDVMVGAGSIATETDAPDQFLARCVKPQPAAKNVDAANLLADQRIIC